MPGPDTHPALLRFLALGVCNTAITYLSLLALTEFVDPRVAYTSVFLMGLAFNTVAAGPVLFRVKVSSSPRAVCAVWLLSVCVVGIVVVQVGQRIGVADAAVRAVMALLVTAPLISLGGRLLLARRPANRSFERRTA